MITSRDEPGYVRNEVTGRVTIRELLEYAQTGVESWLTQPVLWDLRRAIIVEDGADYAAIRAALAGIRDLAEKRKGQKTTFVTPDPFSYGTLRMALTIADYMVSRPVASVFKDICAAETWLKEAAPDP